MKSVLFYLLLTPVLLYSQQSSDSLRVKTSSYNVIRVDLVGLTFMPLTGMYMLKGGYERNLGQHFSAGLTLEKGKYSSGHNDRGFEYFDEKAFGIMPALRFYPFVKRRGAPIGFFLDLHARYYFLTQNYYSYHFVSKGEVTNLGFNVGYKTRGSRVAFEFLVGFGQSSGKWLHPEERISIPTDELDNDLNSFATMRFEISLCYIFPKHF